MKVEWKSPRVKPLAAFAILAFFPFCQTTWAAGTITIPAPCNNAPSPAPGSSPPPNAFLRTCSIYLNGAPPPPANAPAPNWTAPPGILTQVQQRIQQQESCYYQSGTELNPVGAGNQCSGSFFGYPCSVNPIPMFGIPKPEITQDTSGKNCGSPSGTYINFTSVGLSSSCPQPATPPGQTANNASYSQLMTLLAAPPYNLTPTAIASMAAQNPPTQLQTIEAQVTAQLQATNNSTLMTDALNGQQMCVYYQPNNLDPTKPPSFGEYERSWARGAWVQALAYYTNQVLNEVSCNQSITMPSDPSTNACLNFAQDVLSGITSTQQASAQLVTSLGNQGNIKDINNCVATFQAGANGSDQGPLRQSAQHLCASRMNVESLFSQLVVCDIFQKAQYAYENQAPTYQALQLPPDSSTPIPPVGRNGMQAAFINAMVAQVQNLNAPPPATACHNQCKGGSSMGAIVSCIQSCYQANIVPQWQNALNNLWPLNQLSCTGGSPTGSPFVLPLAPISSSAGGGP